MKILLKQLAQLIASVLALYGVVLVASLLLVPRSEPGSRLNTAKAGSSLFLTEPKYVFMTRSQLDTAAEKVILVGASNMQAGFKQADVQALMPGVEVHNLSVGGSNITQIEQIVGLVQEAQSPDARRGATFVIGLWYGVFAADKARWYTPERHAGDTDIDIERYRYGFYRRSAEGPVPVLPARALDLGVGLIHPYLVLDWTARNVNTAVRARLPGGKPVTSDAQRNAVVLNTAQRQHYLSYWREYMGGVDALEDAPFATLDRMVDSLRASGARVVLVDLPIPHWHAEGAMLAQDYRRRIDPQLERLAALPGVRVLKFGDDDADDDFSDEVHPKPRVTPRWASRLTQGLQPGPDSLQKL
ncbi:MAG: hypothetical protein JWQ88_1444 [Rhodoferax sp.]|nr:hypothetical protein [Rhodoferax sp.]